VRVNPIDEFILMVRFGFVLLKALIS